MKSVPWFSVAVIPLQVGAWPYSLVLSWGFLRKYSIFDGHHLLPRAP